MVLIGFLTLMGDHGDQVGTKWGPSGTECGSMGPSGDQNAKMLISISFQRKNRGPSWDQVGTKWGAKANKLIFQWFELVFLILMGDHVEAKWDQVGPSADQMGPSGDQNAKMLIFQWL